MEPRNPGFAETYSGPVSSTNDSVDAKVDLVIWLNARVTSSVKAVACDALAVQVVQVRVFEYLIIASMIGDFNSLVADEYGQVVEALNQAVFDFVQQGVAAVLGILLRDGKDNPGHSMSSLKPDTRKALVTSQT